MALTKAKLRQEAHGEELEFQFNPETFKFSQSATFQEKVGTRRVARQYKGTKAVELSLTMLFDKATASDQKSIADKVKMLLGWLGPHEDGKQIVPHVLFFSWGELNPAGEDELRCHCRSVSVNYTLFAQDGEPLRASADIKLAGAPLPKRNTNPTSGGVRPARSHLLSAGENLATLAHDEYGTTAQWRSVAALNGVDNPFRPPIGQEIILPVRGPGGVLG